MYQFETRPEFGYEIEPNPEPNPRQRPIIQVDRSRSSSAIPFQPSCTLRNGAKRRAAVALLCGCVVAILSGCGGLNFHPSPMTKSAATSSTATLNMVSCGTESLTGAQSKACSVYLSGPAASPTTVTLTSNNSALTVPSAVVVPTGATSTGFNAVSAAVSKSVSVTITGQEGKAVMTEQITLYPSTSSTGTLSQVSCGTQTLTGPTTKACSVYLSAPATGPMVVSLSSSTSALQAPATVTVSAGTSTGGFNVTASAVSTTQTATLTASAGGVSQTAVFQLDGSSSTGPTQHQVKLSWDAPSTTSVAVVGYNVYRATVGVSGYALLSSPMDTQTSYSDSTVQGGLTYDYVVKSVNTDGVESSPSNATQVTIP